MHGLMNEYKSVENERLISIVTINFNDSKGIEKTIKSVINQSYSNIEYLVIDGGSTDDSMEIIQEHSSKIDYWISEPDKGIYNAMNKGILKATGDYIIFINSGDSLEDNSALERAVSYFNNEDIIVFDINSIDGSKKTIKSHPQILSFYYLFNTNIAHQAQFTKRTLFDKVGLYDENLRYLSDWKFNILALFKHFVSFKSIQGVTISNFMMDGVSSSLEHRPKLDAEREKVLKEEFAPFYDDYKRLNPIFSIVASRSKNKGIRKVQTLLGKIVIYLSRF